MPIKRLSQSGLLTFEKYSSMLAGNPIPLPVPPIANPVVWYDASYEPSITLSGSNVTQINDISGNNRHAKQTTASAQPTVTEWLAGGLKSLNMDGGDYLLPDSNFSLTNLQVFAVVEAGSTERTWWGWSDYLLWYGMNGERRRNPAVSSSPYPSNAFFPDTQAEAQHLAGANRKYYMEADWKRSTFRHIWLQGSIQDNSYNGTDRTGSIGSGKIILGARSDFAVPLIGKFAELIAYDEIDTTAATTVRTYLRDKWSI